ncbi:hypothetical protein K6V26_06485 [Parabacteroides goldsteinii]|uniref:BACON domain-containing protein n=1 Tax=Parabacteroides goldsteinii TaxID=328812 RepID=UPI001CCE1BBA|nr:BACON domain-containing carbohydrate-binding protein [Parabacteroides goldsteinii]UBD75974.1 hypothetical protein K6V26_06485 [Parabacteroides goldsteinii]
MKKKKYYLMALASLLMVACSEDMETFGPAEGNGGKDGRELTFLFSGTAQGYVPYTKAEGGIALNAENELSTLDIYVFGEDSLSSADPKPVVLEEILRSGADAAVAANTFALTTSGKDNLVTISVGEGKKKKFYFVANARDQLSLADVQLHKTDTASFKEKLGNSQKDLIACPMLMSGSCEMVLSDASKDNPVKVELMRRVARFDISNDSEETNFVIQQIALSNVPGQGPLFAGSEWDDAERVQLPLIDFSTVNGSNAGVAPSVFYLYPTNKTTEETAGEIKFNLIGHSSSSEDTQVVPVKFFDIHGAPVSIQANHRYTVQVDPAGQGSLTATLKVEDWLVGDTMNVQTDWGTIGLSCEDAAFKDNTLTFEAEKAADAGTPITLSVACDGVWELEKDGSLDWLEAKVVTGEGGVINSFTVQILTTNYSAEQRQGVITVVNKNQPSVRQSLIVVQKGNEQAAITFSADLSSIGGASLIGNVLKMPASQKEAVTVQVATGISGWKLTGGSYTGLAVSKTEAGLSITPTENKSTNSRTNTITLTDKDDNELTTLRVIQSSVKVGTIVVKCMDLEETGTGSYSLSVDAKGFPETGQETGQNNHRKISVVAITGWEYAIIYPWDEAQEGSTIEKGDEWLSVYNKDTNNGITENLGTHNGYFYLKATANETGEARTAKIRILDTATYTSSATITITQAAGN